MTSTRPAPVLGWSLSEYESENVRELVIRVGMMGAVLSFDIGERLTNVDLSRLCITLVGQSTSDVLLIPSPVEDRHIAHPESSDSALPQVSRGIIFYGDLSDLEAALDELASIADSAKDDDCLEPTLLAIENADLLVKTLYNISPRRYDIYPMSGGEVVIDGGHKGRRVGVFCYPDGRILYVGWEDGIRRKVSRDNSDAIPREFLGKVLHQLDAFEQHEQQPI